MFWSLNANVNTQIKGVKATIHNSNKTINHRIDKLEHKQAEATKATNTEVANIKTMFLEHREAMNNIKEDVKKTTPKAPAYQEEKPAGLRHNVDEFRWQRRLNVLCEGLEENLEQ